MSLRTLVFLCFDVFLALSLVFQAYHQVIISSHFLLKYIFSLVCFLHIDDGTGSRRKWSLTDHCHLVFCGFFCHRFFFFLLFHTYTNFLGAPPSLMLITTASFTFEEIAEYHQWPGGREIVETHGIAVSRKVLVSSSSSSFIVEQVDQEDMITSWTLSRTQTIGGAPPPPATPATPTTPVLEDTVYPLFLQRGLFQEHRSETAIFCQDYLRGIHEWMQVNTSL